MQETENINELSSSLKEYVNTQYKLLQLEMTAKLANFGAWLFSGTVFALAFILALLFGSLGAGFYLSKILESYTLGFLTISGIYFLVFCLIALLRKKTITEPLRDRLVRELLRKEKEQA